MTSFSNARGSSRYAGARSAGEMADRARRLARIRRLAWVLDAALRVPGTKFRFGLNSVVGLTPALGDAAMTAISMYIVYEAYQLGLPKQQLARMIGNVAMEAAAGSVPVLGTLFDTAFKANLRNIALIDAHIATGARS
ncbi:DUF4112 domain-containing protein [Lichenicola sp.]|uniref:DUF4112 domain-containing protein n=1 Tax=Lichenicola sp. TaxID=2804529 RepID=UPI003AFF721E